MKRNHILALVGIVVAVAAILATLGDASTYVNFAQAEKDMGSVYTVIGTLDTSKPMNYDARSSRFTFFARDKQGEVRQVVYNQPKPQDFERAEEVTMKGYAEDSVFVAGEILMKCPSKYNGQEGIANNTYSE